MKRIATVVVSMLGAGLFLVPAGAEDAVTLRLRVPSREVGQSALINFNVLNDTTRGDVKIVVRRAAGGYRDVAWYSSQTDTDRVKYIFGSRLPRSGRYVAVVRWRGLNDDVAVARRSFWVAR